MPCEAIRAIVEDGMGTWLRADPVGRLLWAQPSRNRDAAASARRRAEFMEDPRSSGPCDPFLCPLVLPTCTGQIRLNRGHGPDHIAVAIWPELSNTAS